MTHRRILAGIILVYLLLAAGMSVIVPLGESPDEVDHFAYIHFLARERRLPVMQPAAAENETMEANQPPLFYALNAVLLGPLLQVDWS